MATILDQRTSLEKTIKIFDKFYEFESVINGAEYDIVHGYLKSVSKVSADNLTVALFRISQETKIPVLSLLDSIKGKTNLEMNQSITYYLNSIKSKTALYGVSMVPQPNHSVARNIVY